MNGRDHQDDCYRKVFHLDHTRITLSDDKFELLVQSNTEINEQVVMHAFRDWIRWRKNQKKLREYESMSR